MYQRQKQQQLERRCFCSESHTRTKCRRDGEIQAGVFVCPGWRTSFRWLRSHWFAHCLTDQASPIRIRFTKQYYYYYSYRSYERHHGLESRSESDSSNRNLAAFTSSNGSESKEIRLDHMPTTIISADLYWNGHWLHFNDVVEKASSLQWPWDNEGPPSFIAIS